jgi:isoleucyl-tRNA synthetase
MSKSRGNAVEPWDVIDRFGADALRWYFFTSKQPWDGYRFSSEAVGEGVRLFLRQLWNTYGFYVLYANANMIEYSEGSDRLGASDLDTWIESRLSATVTDVRERMDAFDATSAGRAVAEFVDDLSNWYVRRTRRRFWNGDLAAHATLRDCLVTVAQLLAPFVPFVADEIYDNVDGSLASVHLCDFPEPRARDLELEAAMATARETVRLGLAARAQAKVKNRQPLGEAVIVAAGRERAAIERLAEMVREELNVKRLRFVAAADELGRYELRPNYRTLGPRFGRTMPQVTAAIAALDPAHVAAALREQRPIAIAVDGADHELRPDDVTLALAPLDGFALEREGSHAVALELTLDEALLREGRAREIVHAVQAARKNAGLRVEDRIQLTLDGDASLIEAAREHADYIAGETLAVKLEIGSQASAGSHSEAVAIDGLELRIALARVV